MGDADNDERYEALLSRANEVPRSVWTQPKTPFVKAQEDFENTKDCDKFEAILIQAEKKAKAKANAASASAVAADGPKKDLEWLSAEWKKYQAVITADDFPKEDDAKVLYRTKTKIDNMFANEKFVYNEETGIIEPNLLYRINKKTGELIKAVTDGLSFDLFYKKYDEWKESSSKKPKRNKAQKREREEEKEDEKDFVALFETKHLYWLPFLDDNKDFAELYQKLKNALAENDKTKIVKYFDKVENATLACPSCDVQAIMHYGTCHKCFLSKALSRIDALRTKKLGLSAEEKAKYQIKIENRLDNLYESVKKKKAAAYDELFALLSTAEKRLENVEPPKKPVSPEHFEKCDKELSKAIKNKKKKKKKNDSDDDEEEEEEEEEASGSSSDEEDDDEEDDDGGDVFSEETFVAFFAKVLPHLHTQEDRDKFSKLFEAADFDAFAKAVETYETVTHIIVLLDSNGREIPDGTVPAKWRNASSAEEAQKNKTKFLQDHPSIKADQVVIREVQ